MVIRHLLFSLLVGLLVGLAAVGILLARVRKQDDLLAWKGDALFLALLALAAFAVGAFLTYSFS